MDVGRGEDVETFTRLKGYRKRMKISSGRK